MISTESLVVRANMSTTIRSLKFYLLRRSSLRKYLYTVPLALILFTPTVCAQDNVVELTNADVLSMVRNKVSPDSIIEKIQTSRCHFDTFPTVISELRYRGVPEEILVAMVEAPIGRPTKQVQKKTAQTEPTPPTGSGTTQASNPAPATRSVTAQGEKTVTEASAGKAPMPVKLKTLTEQNQTQSDNVVSKEALKNASVSPAPKQGDENRAATLPLPEPARVLNWATVPATNVVMSGPSEKRLPEPNFTEPKQPPQVLTNSDIIKLLRSGSPVANVVTAIKSSPGNYDLSAKALLELREAGADATVFLSMMEVNQKASHDKSSSPAGTESVQNKKN